MAEREGRLKFETELHEKKLKMKADLKVSQETTPTVSTPSKQATAKLPNISIAKFEGSFLDWPRFWGQFIETIDKADIPPITKFTYLCGSLGDNVRISVEALLFTSEGYNRAKSILQGKHGKESEIVKRHNKEIIDLPYISSATPRKIREFSEKLTYCVEALESMKQLNKVNGNVHMTLDKLPAIRGDLVRTDSD